MRKSYSLRACFAVATTAVAASVGCQASEDAIGTRREALVIHVPGDAPTIQAAIDAAAVDDVVEVAAGHFTENLVVKPGVILMGAGMDRTVLHGRVVLESGDGHVIAGFRITREGALLSSPSAGIAKDCAGRGPNTTITRNQIDGFGTGIVLAECPGTEITRNRIKRNERGLELTDLGGPVTDNLVLYNRSAGVVLRGCSVTFAHNTLVGNGFAESIADGGAALVSIGSNADHAHNNIVVSNNAGLNQLEVANLNFSRNLVWGNSTNFAGQAVAHPTDLSADPRFVDSGTDDLHLRPDSPALDTGANDAGTEVDFDGVSRPQGAAVDLGAFERPSASADRRLVISEVLANPVDEDRGEFVEIYNAGADTVNLAGLYLGDGDALDQLVAFSGGPTSVAAGAYAVIVDSESVGGYDIPAGTTVVTTANTTLGSGLSTNDPVTLYADAGSTALATYAHPFDPGNGVSVERVALAGADVETNWRASPCLQSAGRPNCAPLTLAAGLIISEVLSNPTDEATGEFVELYNGTDTPVDVAGMVVSDGDSADAVVAWGGGPTVVPGTTYAVILDPDFPPASVPLLIDPSAVLLTVGGSTLGSGLSTDDPVTILDGRGAVVDSYTRTLAVADGRSVEKVSLSLGDVLGNWAQSSCPTGSSPGRLNCVSSASAGPRTPLVISEVMSNPLDEDSGEFLELYNRGIDPVDAEGLILGDGDAVDDLVGFAGGPTLIPAGGYALVLDAEYAGQYSLPPGTTLLSTRDTTIGSSLALDDPLRLYESNGVEVIDSFRFPFNPGNGRSAERVDLRAFDSAANWAASTCASGSSPGADNCAAVAGGLPKQLRLTEVLSNQAGVETGGAGEFLELLNVGDRAVDLAGMSLESGTDLSSPARDGLVARGAGGTVVVPGAFAVVVDADYDARYTFPAGTVVLTIDDANLGSSGLATTHRVQLVDVDGLTLLDRFAFPSDPGDGVSLHRVSLRVVDSAANWTASSCGASPGAIDCPGAAAATTYVSFWLDRYGDEAGIYWYQAIGWPDWHGTTCELNIVCDDTLGRYRYRDNFPATRSFGFQNPYRDHSVVFVERSSPTDDCGGMSGTCTAARFVVAPGALATVPASSRGYYFARTDGPTLNTLDWFGGDPALYWSIPPDGILAPFSVEVTP